MKITFHVKVFACKNFYVKTRFVDLRANTQVRPYISLVGANLRVRPDNFNIYKCSSYFMTVPKHKKSPSTEIKELNCL